jgi:hypothetical protein
MKPFISKSKFLSGLQCPKLLWYYYNAKDKIPPPDEATQTIFDTGHEVGNLAKLRYPDGIEVPMDRGIRETVADTKSMLPRRVPIFEASFLADDCYCRVDVLVPAPDGRWDIVEVKSTTGVKSVHVFDLAFQTHCLERSGLTINRKYLMHLNNKYVRDGGIDVDRLFTMADATAEVDSVVPDVPDRVVQMLDVIVGPEPDVMIGRHCTTPYDCPLKPFCWRFLPDHNVTDLYRARKDTVFDLVTRGKLALTDVSPDELTKKHLVQRDAVKKGRPHVAAGGIRGWLDRLEFPLYCLDFETVGPAVPLYDGTRPYQQVPFQFSLHVLDSFEASPVHCEFLAEDAGDPRPGLVGRLHAIGPKGSVLAFNMTFEKRVLGDLAKDIPDERQFLGELVDRMDDLLIPFRRFHYYHPDQRGSCSLKAVLPALTGKSYGNLAIHDGMQAAREFQRTVIGDSPQDEKETVLANLREYCRQDTEAMVDIVNALRMLI